MSPFSLATILLVLAAGRPPALERSVGDATSLLLRASALREVSAARADGDEGLRQARQMREEALDLLRPAVREAPRDAAVLRALALYHGLGGDAAGVSRVVEQLDPRLPEDPWIAFAATYARARDEAPFVAVVTLRDFVARHPEIEPPYLTVARLQISLGRSEEALATLDALLARDPDAFEAKETRAALFAPPPLVAPPPVPRADPPRGSPGYLPRKSAP